MRKIKAAVVGVGNMGQHHARVYSQLENVRLVAVCDLNEKRARETANKYKTRPFTDYHKLIKLIPKIDMVSVAVPTKFHQEVACFFLQNKVNVLVEKPIADTLKSAEKIIKISKDNGVKLMIGHTERFNPGVIALKKLIKKGKLGKIISLIGRRVGVFPPSVSDTNVFLDLAIHDVDIVNYLLDEQPTMIYKHRGKFHAKKQEDTGEIFLIYKNAAAFIQVNWITPVKIRTLAITGTKGYAELDYISQDLILHQAKIKKRFETFSDFVKFSHPKIRRIKIKKEEPLKREIESFIENIMNNTEPLVNADEALKTLEICLSK